MKYEPDFTKLIDLSVDLLNAQAGTKIGPGNAWLSGAQTLSKKLLSHMLSMRAVSLGAEVKTGHGPTFFIVDHASVKVLARAALETYLVLYFLYSNQDEGLSKFRYSIWRLGGLIDRQGIHTSIPEHTEALANELKIVEALREEIKASPYLSAYTPKQQAQVLAGNWRVGVSWVELGVNAGFHRTYFQNIYEYLCGYSHSSYASTLQIRDAETIDEQRMLSDSLIGVSVVVLAHFACTYAAIFPKAASVLESSGAGLEFAEKWRLGPEDMAEAYGR